MDKSEYKLRAEEIKDLISRGEYAQAAEIADTIDWRRVKSVMMLCTISDLPPDLSSIHRQIFCRYSHP